MCFKQKRTEETITAFNNSLKDQDWSPVVTNSNVDKAYDDFMHICVSLYKYCPVIKYSNSKISTKKWLTKGILNACKKKQNLYRLFIKQKTGEAEHRYKLSIHPSIRFLKMEADIVSQITGQYHYCLNSQRFLKKYFHYD